MPALYSYDYVFIRLVPRVEREEFLNVGAVLFCRTRHFLAARLGVDRSRLAAVAPHLDTEAVLEHLEIFAVICRGGEGAGPIGALSASERFHWLVAPRSTVVQTSPIHCGLCSDPAVALDHLIEAGVKGV